MDLATDSSRYYLLREDTPLWQIIAVLIVVVAIIALLFWTRRKK